jgi:ABC-type sugar transport system substrate-binding protein
MKKVLVVLLVAVMAASMVFANGSAEQTEQKVYKIGVGTIHEGETWEIQKAYYENEVGPALNMEFMFSEKLSDANGLVDFMDQAYAAGCDGIISFVTSNDAVAQGSRKAEEMGIWFVTQNSALNKDVQTVEHNLGHCGASATGMARAYSEAITELLSDGEYHSIFIFSGAAVGGAIGQGAASHYYTVEGILEAMQEKYGLVYESSIDDIINNQNPGEVATGNPNVKIYIYPGTNVTAALTAAQTQFQNGPYDMFAATFRYSSFTNALADVEKSTGKNIKILGTVSIEKQTSTGFATKDTFGDSVLNAAVLNPLNIQNGMCAVIMYNALTGHADAMKAEGKTILFKVEPWFCKDAETYEKISTLDTSHETYILNADDLHALCVDKNPSVTYKDIEAKLAELADVNSIIADKLN